MFDANIHCHNALPLSQDKRKITDSVCLPISILFPIILFIIACVSYDKGSWDSLNSFSDQNGYSCGNQEPVLNKKFLFFKNPNDLSERQCVEHCPVLTFTYESPKGLICLSRNKQQRQRFFNNQLIQHIWDFQRLKQTLIYTAVISLCLGVIWIAIFMILPKIAPVIALLGSTCILFVLGQVLILNSNHFWNDHPFLRYFISAFCFLLGLIMIIKLCFYLKEIHFQQAISNYSTFFLRKFPLMFLYISLFLLLMSGLVSLFIWQLYCFACSFRKTQEGQLYEDINIYNFWNILNILQFIWGVQFLKDAFNFCVTGHAISFWFNRASTERNLDDYTVSKQGCKINTSFGRLICTHWGSVVGGSFLNAFFEIPAIIVQLLTCHPDSCCKKPAQICYKSCNAITGFFDLVRTDSYSYIHMTGIPFCNACRQCSKICLNCQKFVGYSSPSKHYRRCATIFLCSLSFLLGMLILNHKVIIVDFWKLVLVLICGYIILCFFVGIHSDICQGFQTCYLIDKQLGQFDNLQNNKITRQMPNSNFDRNNNLSKLRSQKIDLHFEIQDIKY